jgi:4-carboxymuconolactone decarboxylase
MTSRVPLLEPDDASDASRKVLLEMADRAGGIVPGIFKALANSSNALQMVLDASAALGNDGLDPNLRELIVLTVCQEMRCVVPWTSHLAVAEKNGIDRRLLEMIGTSDIEQEPPPTGMVLRYARLLTRNESVSDDQFAALRDQLGDRAVVDVTVMIGFMNMVCRIFGGLGVPLPGEAKPFVTRSR